MHSWVFRRREELARVYGLSPLEERRSDADSTGAESDFPEVGREILLPARRRPRPE